MPAEPERVPVGSQAPDFALAGSGHSEIRLSDHRGRDSVLLVFLRAFG